MSSGPYRGARAQGEPSRERFGSQWSDNVGRMHKFMERYPGVEITVPMKNGTDDFIATWEEDGPEEDEEKVRVEVKDRSLGWLMDHLEARFKGA